MCLLIFHAVVLFSLERKKCQISFAYVSRPAITLVKEFQLTLRAKLYGLDISNRASLFLALPQARLLSSKLGSDLSNFRRLSLFQPSSGLLQLCFSFDVCSFYVCLSEQLLKLALLGE